MPDNPEIVFMHGHVPGSTQALGSGDYTSLGEAASIEQVALALWAELTTAGPGGLVYAARPPPTARRAATDLPCGALDPPTTSPQTLSPYAASGMCMCTHRTEQLHDSLHIF